jgi:DNA-binding NtrC family response regulator
MSDEMDGRQLLIVDDELAMRQALEASFARAGWRVETAAGVAEGLEKAARGGFPVVLTDMRMLDGTGLELLRGLEAARARTAVIVLTAYGSVPDAVEAMRSGACEYLIKPVSFDRLAAAAERAWERMGVAAPALASTTAATTALTAPAATQAKAAPGVEIAAGLPLREVERRLLEATLEATGGNRTHAAEMLGISLRTIRNKIRAYGLPPRRYA